MNQYLIIAIVVAVLIAAAFILIRAGYKKQVCQVLFYLVNHAEQTFGGGTGDLKFAAVTDWIFSRMPIALRLFFTPKQIDRLIEEAVTRMKNYLAANSRAAAFIGGAHNVS